MLTRGQQYADLGENHFDALAQVKTANRLLKRLKDIGVEVLNVRVSNSLALQLPDGAVSL